MKKIKNQDELGKEEEEEEELLTSSYITVHRCLANIF